MFVQKTEHNSEPIKRPTRRRSTSSREEHFEETIASVFTADAIELTHQKEKPRDELRDRKQDASKKKRGEGEKAGSVNITV